MLFRNWAGSIRWKPKKIYSPTTLEQIKHIIKNNEKILIAGSKHSYSNILKGEDDVTVVMSLKKYKGVEFYKKIEGKNVYSVKSGTDLKYLVRFLKKRHETIQNMGTTTYQTIGGVISTNTHGTGNEYGGFCDQVYSYDVMDASGNYHKGISKENNPELFYAIGAGIGAIAVIITVRIYVEKMINLRYTAKMTDQENFFKEFLQNAEKCSHVDAYWFPYNKKAYVIKKKKTTDDINVTKLNKLIKNYFVSIIANSIYPNLLKIIKRGSKFNGAILRVISFFFYKLLPNEEFIDDKPGALIEEFSRSPWKNINDGEINTSTDNFELIMNELSHFFIDHLDSSEIYLEFPVHVRTVKGDRNYLSPFYSVENEIFVSLSFPNIPNEPEDIFSGVVSIVDNYNGISRTRFHLGKNIPLNTTVNSISERYPGIESWRKIYHQFNNKKILTNEFVLKYLN